MAEIKQAMAAFAAQGKLGELHFSHHNGKTYAYLTSKEPAPPATPILVLIRSRFGEYNSEYATLTQAQKAIFVYLSRKWRPRYKKDCKPGRWSQRNWYVWAQYYYLRHDQLDWDFEDRLPIILANLNWVRP